MNAHTECRLFNRFNVGQIVVLNTPLRDLLTQLVRGARSVRLPTVGMPLVLPVLGTTRRAAHAADGIRVTARLSYSATRCDPRSTPLCAARPPGPRSRVLFGVTFFCAHSTFLAAGRCQFRFRRATTRRRQVSVGGYRGSERGIQAKRSAPSCRWRRCMRSSVG